MDRTSPNKIAPIKTKRSYVFITGGDFRMKQPSVIILNCNKDSILFGSPLAGIRENIRLAAKSAVTAQVRPNNLVVVTPVIQEGDSATIMKLCNFSLIVFNLYDEGIIS